MANPRPPCHKMLVLILKAMPFLLILCLLKGLSLFEYFPELATAILEVVCDTLSAMASLLRVPIPITRCLNRYSRFEQFPELPSEVQEMVFEAIGRTAKPRLQLLAFGTKPAFRQDSSRRSGNGAEFLLELKNCGWRERELLLHLANLMSSTMEYDGYGAEANYLIHSWFLREENKDRAEVEQVNGITYATSQRLARVHPVRCLYIDQPGDTVDKCTGRETCLARYNRRVRFSPKYDIFSACWLDVEIDRRLDVGHDIPKMFCKAVPALADIEHAAFFSLGPETWVELHDRLVDHWPCEAPQLREIYLICTGDIAPIGSAVLPAPFLESGGFKFTQLDQTQVLFSRSLFKDENMAFDVARRAQQDYDARYDLLMKEGRLPLETEVLPKEYSRRSVQVKVVHMGLRDTSL
ncbi:hypothetical protein B0T18DRAFT_394996 [Schizothecium vesticola]|uniref:Uncharacterized protein n=1 Tax=Schizothecium vesticola TaxID=314040 RepID=A0AA40BQZ5_9PEZI|nr:hypothetical protein B0T18DRAFT_394996 [Schizothecium vesticola]